MYVATKKQNGSSYCLSSTKKAEDFAVRLKSFENAVFRECFGEVRLHRRPSVACFHSKIK